MFDTAVVAVAPNTDVPAAGVLPPNTLDDEVVPPNIDVWGLMKEFVAWLLLLPKAAGWPKVDWLEPEPPNTEVLVPKI